ncbi:hypothetical protein AR546_11015 [Leptospira interrogans serovar Canicola]|nr:hypothetical protein B2G50_21285 [Leptospira interrogans serovar Canicola]OLZ31356.1 hypothetical protein AR546_11015 [Leptospira interrogans serovar Canicola]OMH62335.1 hypothetical protein BW243_19070 [Leptospira interrogans serovar Pomona]
MISARFFYRFEHFYPENERAFGTLLLLNLCEFLQMNEITISKHSSFIIQFLQIFIDCIWFTVLFLIKLSILNFYRKNPLQQNTYI